jgi:antagonist of KipI
VRFVPITHADDAAAAAHGTIDRSGRATPPHRPGIAVVDGGMLTTVQDLGRRGWQRYGVPVAGAMDGWALRAANRLVGNADGAAGLELTLAGPALQFDIDAVMAVTGADLGAHLDGSPIATWQSHRVRAGSVLSFGGARSGLRAYVAVAGGIEVPVVLGSRSTFTRSGFGGFEGRALRAGDLLPIGGAPQFETRTRRLRLASVPAVGRVHRLRVIMGPQDEAFTQEGIATFLSAGYSVTPQSDRVGCRLAGPRVAHRTGADIVSDGTAFGTVQVTGDGVPIVLLADRGTTGGYAKIATIISADLGCVAQAAPGDRVRFVRVDPAEACAAARARERALEDIELIDVRPSGVPDEVYDEDGAAALAGDAYADLARAIGAVGAIPSSAGELVRAAMPGLVVDVLVAERDTVAASQILVSIEAMKMQNPVRAPRAGCVARVLVARGDSVVTGMPLVEFDP